MDFKHINDKHATPKSEINILERRISRAIAVDSPFRNMPNFSTPPSRFAKIINPFEPHILDRLHLPTFSPNVFLQNSTPKAEQKFKWTIDDISSLKPAEIDESMVSQHVTSEDPDTESLVQKRIERFFSEKPIVPSPLNIKIQNVPIIKDCDNSIVGSKEEGTPVNLSAKETSEGATQTILTLPPTLPAELEEALKPYFKYSEDKLSTSQTCMENSLYRQLFEFDAKSPPNSEVNADHSLVSSPAISSGLSPIQFSPGSGGIGSPFDMPELKDCNLSPISKTSPKLKGSKSACRLSFSEKMSVDASLMVPDLDNDHSFCKDLSRPEEEEQPFKTSSQEKFGNTSSNWSIEYKQMSVDTHCSGADLNMMDISNSNTPHARLYTGKGQRKRLSESFKEEECDKNQVSDNAFFYEDGLLKTRNKLFKNDQTDVGYCTQDTGDFSNNHDHVFASTPSKRQYNLQV